MTPMPLDQVRFDQMSTEEKLDALRIMLAAGLSSHITLQTPPVDIGVASRTGVTYTVRGPVTIVTFTIANNFCDDDPTIMYWDEVNQSRYDRKPISPQVRTSIVPDPPVRPLPPPPPATHPLDQR